MNRTVITAVGLKFLERVMRTCPPVLTNGREEAKRHLVEMAKRGQQMKFSEFRKVIPKCSCCDSSSDLDAYEQIVSSSNGIVDEHHVVNFFSGKLHAEKIKEDIVREGLFEIAGKEYAERQLFGHMLIPVVISSCDGGFAHGRYVNSENINIEISNLLVFSCDEGFFEPGEMYFCHYGFLIAESDRKLINISLEENLASEDFMKAARSVSKRGMDFSKMAYYQRSKDMQKMDFGCKY